MSNFIGQIEKPGTDEAFAIVSTSTQGVEIECEPRFVLSPEQTLAYANVLIRAAGERLAYARELAGEIRDPDKLAELVPLAPEQRRRRIVRGGGR